MEIITMLFTSTVVSAIVTALVGYFSSRRANMLKFITEERKKWRDEMRVIAEKIERSKRDNIGKVLTKVKVRINAYGSTSLTDYQKDGHIWKLIRDLEEETISNEQFNRNKKLLIDYISLLLKADWERSKKEVRGTFRKVLQYVLIFMSVLIFTCFYFVVWELNEISSYVIHVVYLIVFAVFLTFVFQAINRKILSDKVEMKKRVSGFVASLGIYIVGMIWLGSFFVQRWERYPMDDRILILSCIYFSLTINLWELIGDLRINYRYDDIIKQLPRKVGEEEKQDADV